MKICFISGNINKTGGTERVCLLIANELSKRYEVSILSIKEGLNPSFKCSDKINLYSLGMEEKHGFFTRKISPYIKLKKFLREHKQDIIINVDVLLCLYSIPMKWFYKHTKIIAWEHFNYRQNNGTKNRDYARRLSAKYADCIIVLTNADLNEYNTKLKIKSKIVRIYNPIVGKIENNKSKENIVLASGRFSYSKNFQELINIWEHIEKKNSEWQLVICGDGEDMEEIKNMIKNKKLKNVKLTGFCKNIHEYYKKAKIFVMTSRYEGFPMVLLEAQQHSIPLVAYDCFTGPSEIIDNNRNGYLIEYGNKSEFLEKLDYLMNNPSKIKEFSKYSEYSIKKYDISNIIKEWYEVINSLSDKNR